MINPPGMKERKTDYIHSVKQWCKYLALYTPLSKAFRFSIKLTAEWSPAKGTFTSDKTPLSARSQSWPANFHSSSSPASPEPSFVVSLEEEDIGEFLPTNAYLQATDLPKRGGEKETGEGCNSIVIRLESEWTTRIIIIIIITQTAYVALSVDLCASLSLYIIFSSSYSGGEARNSRHGPRFRVFGPI